MVCTTSEKKTLQGLFKGKFRFSRTKIFLKESFTIFTSSSLLSSALAYVHVEDTRLRQRNIPKQGVSIPSCYFTFSRHRFMNDLLINVFKMISITQFQYIFYSNLIIAFLIVYIEIFILIFLGHFTGIILYNILILFFIYLFIYFYFFGWCALDHIFECYFVSNKLLIIIIS